LAGHKDRREIKRNAYQNVLEKTHWNAATWNTRIWKDNIKTDLRKTGNQMENGIGWVSCPMLSFGTRGVYRQLISRKNEKGTSDIL